jgi:hypothetical protein
MLEILINGLCLDSTLRSVLPVAMSPRYMISSWPQIYGFDMHSLTNQCSLSFISCTLQEFWVCVRPGCVLWCPNWTEHLPWNCLVSPGWLLHWNLALVHTRRLSTISQVLAKNHEWAFQQLPEAQQKLTQDTEFC